MVKTKKLILGSMKPTMFHILNVKQACHKCGSMLNSQKTCSFVLQCSLEFIMLCSLAKIKLTLLF